MTKNDKWSAEWKIKILYKLLKGEGLNVQLENKKITCTDPKEKIDAALNKICKYICRRENGKKLSDEKY